MAKVINVQLKLFSQEDVRNQSVCEIKTATLYEKSLPRSFGINDARLGTMNRRMRCSTCGNDLLGCNGHFGHIELAVPVYHVQYIDILVKLARCFCPSCNELILDPKKNLQFAAALRKTTNKNRFFAVADMCNNRTTCAFCNMYLPKYKAVGLGIKRDWNTRAKASCPNPALLLPLTATVMLDWINQWSMENCHLAGFVVVSPKEMIISTLVVPPPAIRPTIMFSESSRTRGQDDLTHKLQDIFKISHKLKTANLTDAQRRAAEDHLQLMCATYFNNDCKKIKSPMKKRSGVPERSLMIRFQGKRVPNFSLCMIHVF
jgi:DNA-directed RNA polymerase II subunit RPB1